MFDNHLEYASYNIIDPCALMQNIKITAPESLNDLEPVVFH